MLGGGFWASRLSLGTASIPVLGDSKNVSTNTSFWWRIGPFMYWEGVITWTGAGALGSAFTLNTPLIGESAGATATITGITAANPGVVTATAHGYSNGDTVQITGVVGMTEVNFRNFTVANKTANTFELSGVNTSTYTAYSSGGTCTKVVGGSAATILTASLAGGSSATNAGASLIGGGEWFDNGVGWKRLYPRIVNSTSIQFAETNQVFWGNQAANGDGIKYNVLVPISGWT